MKKIINALKILVTKKEVVKNVITGVEKVSKVKLDKKKLVVLIIAILAVLVLSGVISEETFIQLFKEVN